MKFDRVVDSGRRTDFGTGSVRDIQDGKGRFDLIPIEPMIRLAQHFENGAKKYGDRNWEKGQPLHAYLNSAMRHLYKLIAGWTDEDHAAAVMWNVGCYIATLERIEQGKLPIELDTLNHKKDEGHNGTKRQQGNPPRKPGERPRGSIHGERNGGGVVQSRHKRAVERRRRKHSGED